MGALVNNGPDSVKEAYPRLQRSILKAMSLTDLELWKATRIEQNKQRLAILLPPSLLDQFKPKTRERRPKRERHVHQQHRKYELRAREPKNYGTTESESQSVSEDTDDSMSVDTAKQGTSHRAALGTLPTTEETWAKHLRAIRVLDQLDTASIAAALAKVPLHPQTVLMLDLNKPEVWAPIKAKIADLAGLDDIGLMILQQGLCAPKAGMYPPHPPPLGSDATLRAACKPACALQPTAVPCLIHHPHRKAPQNRLRSRSQDPFRPTTPRQH